MATITETPEVKTYTLELSEEEAKLLAFIVGNVSGTFKTTDGKTSPRIVAGGIFEALRLAGVRSTEDVRAEPMRLIPGKPPRLPKRSGWDPAIF